MKSTKHPKGSIRNVQGSPKRRFHDELPDKSGFIFEQKQKYGNANVQNGLGSPACINRHLMPSRIMPFALSATAFCRLFPG